MSELTSDILVGPSGLYTSSDLAYAPLGARAVTGDGREFRYARAGGTALVPGTLLQAGPEDTAHQNLAPTANGSAGDTEITVTLGASAVTANEYAGGWAIITTSTGAGYQYQISSHPAANGSATVTLTLADPLVTSIASATTKVDLVLNPYSAVIINPATATSNPIGVAVHAIAANEYGWVQVKGVASVLMDGTGVVGTAQVASNAVAGAVEPATGVQAPVGTLVTGVADTQYGAIDLDL